LEFVQGLILTLFFHEGMTSVSEFQCMSPFEHMTPRNYNNELNVTDS